MFQQTNTTIAITKYHAPTTNIISWIYENGNIHAFKHQFLSNNTKGHYQSMHQIL